MRSARPRLARRRPRLARRRPRLARTGLARPALRGDPRKQSIARRATVPQLGGKALDTLSGVY